MTGIDFLGILTFLKILSGLVSIAFVLGIISSWTGAKKAREDLEYQRAQHFALEKSKKKTSAQEASWGIIKKMFQSEDPHAWRVAILDADSLLEDMITQMGYQGTTFGEKLKALQQDRIPWTQAAWEVHLLRNKLAHEGNRYPLNHREAYRAFKIYENIFFETGYLA